MKSILHITTLAVVLFSFLLASNAVAQDKTQAQKGKANATQQQAKTGPNFVDNDGDGICDNQGTGVGRQQRQGKGQGTGTGECTGDHQRKRLRDGSCGQTPATGTNPNAKGRRSQSAK